MNLQEDVVSRKLAVDTIFYRQEYFEELEKQHEKQETDKTEQTIKRSDGNADID